MEVVAFASVARGVRGGFNFAKRELQDGGTAPSQLTL